MSKIKFFRCDICGNIVGLIEDAGIPMVCCGEDMTELVPNTSEGAYEKHLPVVSVQGDRISVAVGSVAHPMAKEHYIQWIYLETDKGGQRKALLPGQLPEAVFALVDDKAVAAYEYCNLHGLWKTEIV
ncbi:MAG: desulfoferrodoxin family protein [Clostridia bacterium]|nr:desulfoferrodoxin family protein [Clostridia bacterium]